MDSKIKQNFELSRQELLDMGLRGNTLLSLGRGSKVLEIVDEKSVQIFDSLVEQAKTMHFLPAPNALAKDDEKSIPIPELTQYLAEQKGDKRHQDIGLQTQLLQKPLETRLLKLNAESVTFVQEKGVDLLYLATGFLEWQEDTSDKPRYAPLILIPVEIYRENAAHAYKIRYTEAELGTNLTLAAKLKMEYGISLPSFEETEQGYDLPGYFKAVEAAIKTKSNWRVVADKIALSFFSFGKFQMYQDLSDEVWPDDKKPSSHPLIQKIFEQGFEQDASLIEPSSDAVNQAEALQLVLDSDSSQTEAVLAAKSGASLVIQGPPGTGKSQTITNIISQALADNKKILFVAEKMAALEVVKRRLDNCHIGDAVLELHSHKANKKAVLASLERTLLQDEPVTPERLDEIEGLVATRDKLDAYCQVVSAPIGQTDYNYHDALGYLLQLKKQFDDAPNALEDLPKSQSDLSLWTQAFYQSGLAKITECADHLSEHQAPCLNLYSSSQLQDYSPEIESKAKGILADYSQNLAHGTQVLNQLIQALAIKMNEADPQSSAEAEKVYIDTQGDALYASEILNHITNRPDLSGIHTDLALWQSKGNGLLEVAKQGLNLQRQQAKLSSQFLDQAFDYDWIGMRSVLLASGKKWWRFFSGDYRKAKNTYAGLCKDGLKGSVDEWIASIDTLLRFNSDKQDFAQAAAPYFEILDVNQSNWQKVLPTLDWINQMCSFLTQRQFEQSSVSPLPIFEAALDPNQAIELDSKALEQAKQTLDSASQHLDDLCALLHLDSESFCQAVSKLSTQARLKLDADIEKMYALTRFNRLQQSMDSLGLNDWSQCAFAWQHAPQNLVEGFKYRFFEMLVNASYQNQELIRYFDRVAHEKLIEAFKASDANLFSFAQEHLVKKLYQNLPNPSARGEVETLRREFNKKRRHMPIRRLLNKAGRVIQQIKPVFMMSPMSIATYLEPGEVEFDLVIYDEASQVKVADALGAMLRGKQVIVVGDTKQMPPTNFFGKQFIADDEDAQESITADMESILGLFLASGAPESMLRWHYRSRHESLIAVSNQEFYDNNLMIFPSSGINPEAQGLSLTHLPDTTYDRGGSRTNQGEAQALAQAVMAHAELHPNQTLGVVAFSTAQRDAILFEVEKLRKENPDLEDFFAEHPEGEDFFVKNLENVQGDERDTIYISIGYGRTPEGRLSSSFGPVNHDGGERRLNVLISRARMNMRVFSNFKADEMSVNDASPFGVRALKHFLHYAEKRELIRHQETGKGPDSPFEEEVITAIRSLGYQVEPQVGAAGFYIDIAVKDPQKPGRYILAVECDGASYHSAKTARDRDRIRQSVLEGLGWRFHRIWSTDWFRHAHQETARLKEAIEAALAFYQDYDSKQSVRQTPAKKSKSKLKPQIARVEVEHKSSAVEYQLCDLSELGLSVGMAIPDVPAQSLAQSIQSILKVESPIHSKLLTARLLHAVGASRSGARINRAIDAALTYLQNLGQIKCDGEFVLLGENQKMPVRNRSDLASNERKFDYVYDGEIEQAAIVTVRDTFSISRDDLVKSVTEILGFSVTSKAMRERVEGVLDKLEASQTLQRTGTTYQAE